MQHCVLYNVQKAQGLTCFCGGINRAILIVFYLENKKELEKKAQLCYGYNSIDKIGRVSGSI